MRGVFPFSECLLANLDRRILPTEPGVSRVGEAQEVGARRQQLAHSLAETLVVGSRRGERGKQARGVDMG